MERVLVLYDNVEIINAAIAEEINSISSPENFFCGLKEDALSFFSLKGYDVTKINELYDNQI